MVRLWGALALAVLSLLLSHRPAAAQSELATCAKTPYKDCDFVLNGWNVHFSSTLIAKPEISQPFLERVRNRLRTFSAILPEARVKELRRVGLWADDIRLLANNDPNDPNPSSWMYHTSLSRWPEANGFPGTLLGGVYIGDVPRLLQVSPSGKISVLFHELAHAYHEQVLGRYNEDILAAFRNAVDKGLYRNVRNQAGVVVDKAYALTNAAEYFAELSEAYFAENGYYPFNHADLKSYDPVGYAMLRRMWEEQPPQPNYTLQRGSGCETHLKSQGAVGFTQFSFRNELNIPLQMMWLDFEGRPVPKGNIPPGGFYKWEKGYTAHSWMLADDSGDCVAAFTSKDATAFYTLRR